MTSRPCTVISRTGPALPCLRPYTARGVTCLAVLALAGGTGLSSAAAQQLRLPPEARQKPVPPAPRVGTVPGCVYPTHPRPAPAAQPPAAGPRLLFLQELEPNDTIQDANVLLGFGIGPGLDPDLSLFGSLPSFSDVDVFRLTLNKGDILGLACKGGGNLDPIAGIFATDGTLFMLNDDGFGLETLYPPGSPWPVANRSTDSAFTFIAPASGDYILGLFPFASSTLGAYELELRVRRPNIEAGGESPDKQILFLDFDGAVVDATAVWGSSVGVTFFSPLSSFLGGWGLTAADEDAVINAIVSQVQSRFDNLRQPVLNGNFPTDLIPGRYHVEVRNSRDHPDPAGQPRFMRMIVGGTIAQLGIGTIGIAEFIDPGNYHTEDTGICLLDLLSANAQNPNSVLSIPRAGGLSVIDAIGIVVGNICAHEAGHMLGNWHTVNFNALPCIMDQGGDLLNTAGAGPNGILGDQDDIDVLFVQDQFELFEGVALGNERTNVNTAFALATGGLPAVPPFITSANPAPGSVLGDLQILSLTFSEPVFFNSPATLAVNGSPATQVIGSDLGPYHFVGFSLPGHGPVVVNVGSSPITDRVGNALLPAVLSYQVQDCNANGLLDDTEIANGTVLDCNANGIIDTCEVGLVRAHAGPAQKIVLGQTAILGDETPATGGAPPYTFAWTMSGNANGESSTEPHPNFRPTLAGTYVPRLIVTDAQGCSAIAFVTVTVDPSNAAIFPTDALCGSLCGANGASAGLLLTASLLLLSIHRRRLK